jgi:DNA-directed RNA polymerase subunit E"
MKACRTCRKISYIEKVCPKCGGDLSEKFSGLVIVIDPEKSEVGKVAGFNAVGTYAIRVK